MTSSPSESAAAVPLAPGFRFHPTDEELVSYYLRRRILGRRLRIDAIAEVDLYRQEPWDLPALSRIRSRDSQWYFFARLDRKVAGAGAGGRGGPGNRTNRATPRGYWKTTGKDREVWHRGKAVGMKKTLVFHAGRAPKGERTNWVMHEYRLLDADAPQDLHVVCRVFQKMGAGPQNGAQYGAPYMEEEWEEEDEEAEAATINAAATEMAVMMDTVDEESNEMPENGCLPKNKLVQTEGIFNPQEVAPRQAHALNETGDGSYDDGAISLEEILKEPTSDRSVENSGRIEEQNVMDDNFSFADLAGFPRQDDGYVNQSAFSDTVNWNNPSNGDSTYWPLKTYSGRNHVNGVLSVEEFFESGTSTQSGQPHCPPPDYQNPSLHANNLPALQVDDNILFYDASSSHSWANGMDDFVNLDDLLYSPVDNPSIFDVGDDLMAYFDATENDIKYDILGSAEGCYSQLPDKSHFAQKGKNDDDSALDGICKTSDANALCGASSSGTHKDMYPGTAVPDEPRDDIVDKSFGKRLVNMLGAIPAPPAMAAEFPPAAAGKSIGPLSPVGSPSAIHVTAGIIQLDGLTFTDSTDSWSSQKNGHFNLLLSFTVGGDVSAKSIGFEQATRMQGSIVSMVMRSGFYLFFVSTIILALSYKVGLCIYGR